MLRRYSLLLLLSVTGIPELSLAAPKIDAELRLTASYSDNVQQIADGGDDSVATEISPSVALSDSGANTDYNLRYQYFKRNESVANVNDREEHRGFASLSRYEFDRKLRLFANSRIFNINRDVGAFFGDLSREERVETINYSAGADYTSGARRLYDFTANLQYLKTDTDDSQVNTEVYRGSALLANGTRQQRSFWQVDSDYSEEDSGADTSQAIHNGLIGMNIIRRLSLFAQANYEKIQLNNQQDIINETWGAGLLIRRPRLSTSLAYNLTEQGDSGDFFSATVNWQPTSRTQIDLDYGRRFFGETYNGSVRHTTRKISQTLRYSDTVSTFSETIGRNGVLLCRADAGGALDLTSCQIATDISDFSSDLVPVTQVVFNEISEEQILNRALIYNFTYTRSKSQFSVSGAWNRSKRLSEALQSQDYLVQKTGTASWGWDFSQRTNVTLSFRISNTEDSDDDRVTTDYASSLIFSNQLNRDLRTILSYTYAKRDTDAALDEFEENQVALSLIANF